MSEGNGLPRTKPRCFRYEELDAWERGLRARGIFGTIARTYRGHDIVHVTVSFELQPGDPLPQFLGSNL